MYTFRAAKKSDLEIILDYPLDRKELFYFFPSASYPLTLQQMEQQLDERYHSTVMLQNDQLVGFANFYKVEKHNIGFIGNVIIKPEKRRQGLGKKLLQTMIKTGFKQLQLKEVHLSCFKNNSRALSFYRNLGFKPYACETRESFDKKPMELIHLKISNSSYKLPE